MEKNQDYYKDPPKPSLFDGLKKLLAPLGIVAVVILKFGAKVKLLIFPAMKFFPVLLKTGGTMLISIWAYSLFWCS